MTIFLPDRPGRAHRLAPGGSYTLGRSEHADIRLDHADVSRIHLVLFDEGAAWRVEDRLSKNGTRLDGRPVDRAELDRRCWLEVGGIAVLIEPEPAENPDLGTIPAVPEATVPEDERLDRMLEHVRSISECERASLWGAGHDGRFELLARVGSTRPAASKTAIQRAAATGVGVFCSDTHGARALARSESVAAGGIRALFAIPLLRKGEGRARAVVYADSREPGKLFTQHDADVLQAVASQISLSLDSQRIRRELEALKNQVK